MDSSSGIVFVFVVGFVLAQGAQVEVDPREVLVLPGQNVTLMCRVAVPLQYCRFVIPGLTPLNLNPKLTYPDVAYYGSGLKAGQCGVTIKKVTEKNNGDVSCTMGVETEAMESIGHIKLIVAREPKIPEMDLSRGVDSVRIYKVNDLLQASCIVRDGRPVGNISWFLNEDPLYGSELSMPTIVDLAKENLQSKIQNLSRILQASDNGKFLRCVAFHPAYPEGRAETSRQLDVKFGPLPQGEIDKFGYTIGQPGVISVSIEANPRPSIEWDIGTDRLKEGMIDPTGKVQAEALRDSGNGRYEASLRLAAIGKHDTEKIYVLRAYNDMGTQDYNIKISTSPEPEGLELGLGGVIGIVISILVVLLIIFTVVFAKVTNRWCFSANQESRALGESSDTESADVRQHRDAPPKNFSPIKLTSFFKKNKDKVSSTDEDIPPAPRAVEESDLKTIDETQNGDEKNKEGALVYAELDLINPKGAKPVVKNDNEKTEYAEIVYTPQEGGDREDNKS